MRTIVAVGSPSAMSPSKTPKLLLSLKIRFTAQSKRIYFVAVFLRS